MRFFLSLLEQGLGSLMTLGINLWLIRNGQAQSYSVYVFWLAIAWVLATCQATLATVHLSALPGGAGRLAERREPERVLLSVSLGLIALVGIGVAAFNAVLSERGSLLWEPMAIVFIPAFLFYQFVRAFAFSRGATGMATGLTAGVATMAVMLLGADDLMRVPPDATRVLLIVGVAYGVSAIVVMGLLDHTIRPMVSRTALTQFSRYLRGSGWIMLGAGSNEVVSRLFGFMVLNWFGPLALARLSVVQVIMRPAWLLSAAWSSVGFPRMATQRADGDRRGVVVTMASGALASAVGSGIWSGLVWLAWPLISARLYRGAYADAGSLVWLWGTNVVVGSVMVALNTTTLAMGEYRRLALIDLAGAVACAGSMALLLCHYDYPASIVGTIIGQVTQVMLMAVLLARCLGTKAARGVVAEAV